ncbi:MAG: AraC family transcriptional regulator [Chitinophagaceae bacterium]|nr:MAG: AraC family transcriptional regulator [Chitinophagaceae bacterium]
MKPILIDERITANKLLHIKTIDSPYLNSPFHFHDNCEMIYIEDGYGIKVIGDHVSIFNKGDIILMGPNVPHILTNDEDFYKGNRHLRSKAIVIYFSPALLDNLLPHSALDSFQKLVKKSSRGLEIIGGTKNVIGKEFETFTIQDELTQLSVFFSILNMLSTAKEAKYLSSETFINTYTGQDSAKVNAIYQFLMKNFKRDIQLEEVADVAHMAPTAFCRFFKQRTQKTFSFFINELRIHHACELMNNPDRTITEIFYECGYHNPTNFNKFFKAITGETPSAYRKKIINDVTL